MPTTMTQEELVEMINKAVITTATGGIQPPEAVDEFVSFAIDQTMLLQEVRTERGIVKSLEVNAIDLGEPVIIAATEATAPDDVDVTSPELPKVTLTPVESLAAFDVSYSFLRKNVRRENANEDINREYAKRIGKDMMLVGLNGDTSNVGSTRTDKALQILDGVITAANADANVNDFTIPADPVYKGSDGVFSGMLNMLDKDLKDQRDDLIFLVSTNVYDDYADELGELETQLGTEVLVTGEYQGGLKNKGVKVMPVYGMPDDVVILTLKQNIVFGFGEEMEVLQQNQHRSRVLEVTITFEFDVKYILGGAIVLGQPV